MLVSMEGGVMLVRSQRSVRPFGASVRQLRNYFGALKARREADRQSAGERRSRYPS